MLVFVQGPTNYKLGFSRGKGAQEEEEEETRLSDRNPEAGAAAARTSVSGVVRCKCDWMFGCCAELLRLDVAQTTGTLVFLHVQRRASHDSSLVPPLFPSDTAISGFSNANEGQSIQAEYKVFDTLTIFLAFLRLRRWPSQVFHLI